MNFRELLDFKKANSESNKKQKTGGAGRVA